MSSNAILNSKYNFIIRTYFHVQNVEKHKKVKIVTLFFLKFVSFCYFIVPEKLRISEILFAGLHTKILIGNRKGVFLSKQKNKKITNSRGKFFLNRK